MRVGFVVQRCGREVNGGAESLCLSVAQRMSRFWQTEVLTTCALDYMRWENAYPEGVEVIDGTPVRRFRVDSPRDVAAFDRLSAALRSNLGELTLQDQEEWMRAQGPISSGLFDYLRSASDEFDAFIFFGYLYATTYFGLPLVAKKAYLAPLAHDEWPIYFPIWQHIFTLPRGFVFQTEEEVEFLRARFPDIVFQGPIAGIGIEAPQRCMPDAFRAKYGIEDPFLLYVGRVDAAKGCAELFEMFQKHLRQGEPRLKLVVIGQEVLPVPFDDDIIYLGFVSEDEKWAAFAACDWLVMPSPHESLSIALLECWAVGRPAIVTARSKVLVGHCQRSNAGLWYNDAQECCAIVNGVDPALRNALGECGRKYVKLNYCWERIERQYYEAVQAE